jgi:hypothetical protein
VLEYRMKERGLWWPGVDLLLGRRRQSDALRRTLRRFASELAAERQFGKPR